MVVSAGDSLGPLEGWRRCVCGGSILGRWCGPSAGDRVRVAVRRDQARGAESTEAVRNRRMAAVVCSAKSTLSTNSLLTGPGHSPRDAWLAAAGGWRRQVWWRAVRGGRQAQEAVGIGENCCRGAKTPKQRSFSGPWANSRFALVSGRLVARLYSASAQDAGWAGRHGRSRGGRWGADPASVWSGRRVWCGIVARRACACGGGGLKMVRSS